MLSFSVFKNVLAYFVAIINYALRIFMQSTPIVDLIIILSSQITAVIAYFYELLLKRYKGTSALQKLWYIYMFCNEYLYEL
jgi:hypothetical protein